MCGICGIVNLQHQPAKKNLASMNQALVHRGPDQQGLFLDNQAGLGSRRLSIIDTSSGQQPIFNEDKSLAIVYNGEAYNYPKLKKSLLKKGHQFKTQTDTEVIIHLYEELGPRSVSRLRGMFALAIWDKKNRQLFLARDHLGIKPLHYFFKNSLFLFSSEIKGILKHPQVKKELDLEALNQYFSTGFGCVPAPRTIFKNIKKLLPGHYLIYKNNQVKIEKYWHLEKTKKIKIAFPEAKNQLLKLIKQSVKDQLVADQKIFGSFLSGGIDSTTIAALANQQTPNKLKTFSIGFEQQSFDESPFAKKASQFINSQHHHKYFTNQDLIKVIHQLAKKIDEPFADSSLLPTYLLAKFTSQAVKVAFSGDGGDELFAGYPTYQAHQLYSIYQLVPKPLREKIVRPLANQLPTSFSNISLDFKLKRFVKADNSNYPPPVRHMVWLGPFSPEEKTKLFSRSVRRQLSKKDSAASLYQQYYQAPQNFNQQGRLQYLDLKTYLADFGLVKTDRASSLASLEVRPPLLTPQIAEFAFSLPASYRLKGLTTKHILKQAVKDLLPKEIVYRPKKGFGAPISQWINQELKELVKEKLAKNRLKKQQLFNPDQVKKILAEHQAKKANHKMKLWSLLMFQLWCDNFFQS